MLYCAVADLYDFGLPRGALPNPARLIASVSAGANTLSLDDHGLATGDPVTFRAESGGTLPAPLVAGTTYYAIYVSDDVFSVTSTVDGGVIDLTTAGSYALMIAPLPKESAIRFASRLIDDMLPAHLVPLTEPIHELVRMTCAELAVGKLLSRSGSASKSLGEMIDAAQKRLERWAKGIPLRGDDVPARANLSASATAPYRDRRGWNRFGGL